MSIDNKQRRDARRAHEARRRREMDKRRAERKVLRALAARPIPTD